MSTHLHPLQRLRQLAQFEHKDISTLLIYGVGIGLMSLAMPVAVQALVNSIAFGDLFQPLLVLTLMLLVLLSFSNTMVALQFYVVEMMERRGFVRLFGISAKHLQNATNEARREHYLPELANRFLDVISLKKAAATLLLETVGYVLQTLIGMILLAFYHPMLMAFDMFLIISILFILLVLGKGGAQKAMEQSRAKYTAMAWLESLSVNLVLGRGKSEKKFLEKRTEQVALEYLNTCERYFRVVAQQNNGALVLHTLANTLLLAMGGWMVIEMQLSLGQLIAAELVVSAMVYGLARLGKTMDNYYTLLASMDKLGYLLDLPQEVQHKTSPTPSDRPCHLVLHGVSLPNQPLTDWLKKVNIEFVPGDRVVITGGSNYGSLLDILYGFEHPASGYVSLDGKDMRDLNLGELRDNIRLVRNEEPYEASILDNLCVGRDLDLSTVRNCLMQVGLLDTIVSLPDGLHHQLSIDGAPLTEEQCLRLTLARAMLAKPRLLLLDGVLDIVTDYYLKRVLNGLFAEDAPWTLVVISQHPDVIARCTRQARIVEGVWQEDGFQS